MGSVWFEGGNCRAKFMLHLLFDGDAWFQADRRRVSSLSGVYALLALMFVIVIIIKEIFKIYSQVNKISRTINTTRLIYQEHIDKL